jgi:ribulose-5-phosphate 4-epimerase/fuculose-1-phosphate aldolase
MLPSAVIAIMTNPDTPFTHPNIAIAAPDIMNDAEWRVRVDLAACYRLCALRGWDDLIYTHISAAVPGQKGHFLINPFGYRFDEICASNLVKVNLAGNIIGRIKNRINTSGFAIHAAVHGARADAACVMHLHNPNGVAVGIQQQGLLPLSQHALRFFEHLAYHDYAGLSLSLTEQSSLLVALGNEPAMMLRNHGTLVCGRSIAEAFVLMDTLDKACEIQLKAQAGGAQMMSPAVDICRQTYLQLIGNGAPEGELEWPALLRKLDQIKASYKS